MVSGYRPAGLVGMDRVWRSEKVQTKPAKSQNLGLDSPRGDTE